MKNSLMVSIGVTAMLLVTTLISSPAQAIKDPDNIVYHVACYSDSAFQWYQLADSYAEARGYASACTSQGGSPKITILR